MSKPPGPGLIWIVLVVPILAGCEAIPPGQSVTGRGNGPQQIHALRHLSVERANAALDLVGLPRGGHVPGHDPNVLALTGTADQRKTTELVLEVMDTREEYCVERIGPASMVRKLPSNDQIAAALGTVTVGTFDEPPVIGNRSRAIIDIRGDSVLAILPVRCRDRLHSLLSRDRNTPSPEGITPGRSRADPGASERGGGIGPAASRAMAAGPPAGSKEVFSLAAMDDGRSGHTPLLPARDPETSETATILVEMAASSDPNAGDKPAERSTEKQASDVEPPQTIKISFAAPPTDPQETAKKTSADTAGPLNGEDLLDLTLPETLTPIQLLDLAGRHLGLNYVYDPREISNEPIALKLHGELRGEMKVRHLYALVQTVLDFMNLAMIRQEGNLVAIVPVNKALQTQPELVEDSSEAIQVGDTIVTRVFNIQHVNVSSVMALLENMKLSVAAMPLDNTNLLLVTCHAGRMSRIEQLVEMIDCPGQPLECRFRRLSFVRATPLIARIRTLTGELEGIVVATPSPAVRPTSPVAPGKPPVVPKPVEPADRQAVYLDTDERTNRILMVGFAEDLTLLEKLIDVLDVAQEDPRTPHIYTIRHLDAQQALDKLQKLEVLKSAPRGPATRDANAADNSLTGEPLVAVLETTNQLVIRAASDQHARIRELLDYIDVTATDARTITAYRIRHIDAQTAMETLKELDLVHADSKASSFAADPNQDVAPARTAVPIARAAGNPLQKAPMVVSRSTNTLLVKATPEQHARIAKVIQYIDQYAPEEEWTYQVYPLESSSPDHLAGLLERLIQETTRDKNGKIEKITPRTSAQITIVPDPNTFSLIVYASQRSQRWIERLIGRLDKRRPQVLIDVTLVEITRADTFEYDLNVVAGANNPVVDNLVVDPLQSIDSSPRLEGGLNLLDQDGNPTGRTRAFYSDEHVQALLTAMQRKNYGRVLAKPKVLVDDGRKGQIVTTDTTTYVKESIQIPQTGTPITTREFTPIEASIELQITPHISEGNLLRLDVFMSRDDFGSRPLSGAPPDKATSKVTTTVFVPDDNTVILGGLVKLNQSKGGSKVPILGDIPLVGVLFRSINNSDVEKKLYVFLKANIVRPYDDSGLLDLQDISERHRDAFEQSEAEFQQHESIPGITPEPMPPEGVLRDYE